MSAGMALANIQRGLEPEYGRPLTPRQLEILKHLVRGQQTKEIAASMRLSPQTVKNHIQSMLRRAGAANRVQLAAYAVRDGLV